MIGYQQSLTIKDEELRLSSVGTGELIQERRYAVDHNPPKHWIVLMNSTVFLKPKKCDRTLLKETES